MSVQNRTDALAAELRGEIKAARTEQRLMTVRTVAYGAKRATGRAVFDDIMHEAMAAIGELPPETTADALCVTGVM